MKTHLKRIVGDVKLTFEELIIVLTQVESCLNSCPLVSVFDDDGIETLMPGHFPTSNLFPIHLPLTNLPVCSAGGIFVKRLYYTSGSAGPESILTVCRSSQNGIAPQEISQWVILRKENMAAACKDHSGSPWSRWNCEGSHSGTCTHPVVKVVAL